MSHGPCVIVTGATGGIGSATCGWLATIQARLVLTARRIDRLESLALSLMRSGAEVETVACDLTDDGAADHIVRSTLDIFGEINTVVNSAGAIEPLGAVRTAIPEAWRNAYELNVFAPLRISIAALPHLGSSHGRLINVTSEVADSPLPDLGAYGSAKAALIHLTRVIALEERNVVALAYNPGPTDTDMMTRLRNEGSGISTEMRHRFVRQYQGEGLLDAHSTARTLAWLAAEAPRDLNGCLVDHSDKNVASPARAMFGSTPPP